MTLLNGAPMNGEAYLRRKDQRGVTAVEYAIMLGLLSLAILIALPNLSDSVLNIFSSTSTQLDQVASTASGPEPEPEVVTCCD